jgi:hypothetical protein
MTARPWYSSWTPAVAALLSFDLRILVIRATQQTVQLDRVHPSNNVMELGIVLSVVAGPLFPYRLHVGSDLCSALRLLLTANPRAVVV